MSPSILALAGIAALILVATLLVARLFWPASQSAADSEDPGAQHNELRTPSLEQPSEARDTSVDAAVAAQITGID